MTLLFTPLHQLFLLLAGLSVTVLPIVESFIIGPSTCSACINGHPTCSLDLNLSHSSAISKSYMIKSDTTRCRSFTGCRSTNTDEVYYSSSPFISASSSYGGALFSSSTVAGGQQKVTLTRFLSHVVQEHPEVSIRREERSIQLFGHMSVIF